MNERIRELAEQALFESDFDDEQNIKITMDIFAELILKECMEQVKDFYQEDRFNCFNAAERIKDHFGVE